MNRLLRFLKNWTLLVAMTCGALSYFASRSIPAISAQKAPILTAISVMQPVLIFCMLFLTFLKVNLKELRPRPWHIPIMLVQAVAFSLLSLWLICCPALPFAVVIEGAMLCMICPTAAAAAVVTMKLKGDAAGLTSYTILINLVVAILVPLFVPLVHPHPGLDFFSSFFLIMGKVFPMLICPFFAAVLVRHYLPSLCKKLLSIKDLAFYIWCVSLSLAIAVSTRSLVHSDCGLANLLGIALASLFCCILQFTIGRRLGRRSGCPIGAGQSLGQKNTMFAIWMGYTFLTPVSSVAGGFYSLWHNMFNTWQLYHQRKAEAEGKEYPADKIHY